MYLKILFFSVLVLLSHLFADVVCDSSLAVGWTVRGSKSDGSEIFCTRPDRPWGQPSSL